MTFPLLRHAVLTVLLPVTMAFPALSQVPAGDLARMEQAAPAAPTVRPNTPRTLLVFTLSQGFRHSAIERATAALEILGRKTGAFTTVVSSDTSVFAAGSLRRFDAVCFNNTTQLTLADPALRASLLEFVASGRGIVGIHAATDNFYAWPEGQALLGGYFDGHPWTSDGTWAVTVEDPAHPVTKAFGGKGFFIRDEIYRVHPVGLRENARVLVRLDTRNEANRSAAGVRASDRDIPISWVRTFGKGRLFYCSLGHNDDVYWNPAVLRHYLDGIQYAMGDLEADATPRPFDPAAMFDRDSLRLRLAALAACPDTGVTTPVVTMDAFLRSVLDVQGVRAIVEESFLAALQGPATAAGKRYLFRALARIGGDASVPVLVLALGDSTSTLMALSALEGIPGTASEAALLNALQTASGTARVGVINALGNRRVAGAAGKLGDLLQSPDSLTAAAAASALGKIGGEEALASLNGSRLHGRRPVLDALLDCAANLERRGETRQALMIYGSLVAQDVVSPVRVAAMRRRIVLAAADAPALIREAMGDPDRAMRMAALQCVREMPTGEPARIIARMLPGLPAPERMQLASSLGAHRDPAVENVLRQALEDTALSVRVEAVKALGRIGDAATAQLLLLRAAGARSAEQAAAHASIVAMNQPGVDDVLTAALRGDQADARVEAVRLMKDRAVPATIPALLGAGRDSIAAVRRETAVALRRLAGEGDLPALLRLVAGEKAAGIRNEFENAAAASAKSIADSSRRDAVVRSALGQAAAADERISLVRILGMIGVRTSLPVLVASLGDPDREVRLAAVRSLGEWPTSEAYADLWRTSAGTKDRTLSVLALRGAVRMIGIDTVASSVVQQQRYRRAFARAGTADERRNLLGLIGLNPSLAGLRIAEEHLRDRQLRPEAEMAAASCAETLAVRQGKALIPLVDRLINSANPAVREKAIGAKKRIERFDGYITEWEMSGPYMKPGVSLFTYAFAPEYADSPATWVPLPKNPDTANPWLAALDKVVGGINRVVYLRTNVWSDSTRDARIECGSDDGIRVWLNGTMVHENDVSRGVVDEEDHVAVGLHRGWNELMVKINQGGGEWGARARIRHPDGTGIPDVRYSTVKQ